MAAAQAAPKVPGPVGSGDSLALPLDMSHHFSEMTKRRAQSKIKQFYKYFQIPGIGQLAGGEAPFIIYLFFRIWSHCESKTMWY
jgi:hypothetical protein